MSHAVSNRSHGRRTGRSSTEMVPNPRLARAPTPPKVRSAHSADRNRSAWTIVPVLRTSRLMVLAASTQRAGGLAP